MKFDETLTYDPELADEGKWHDIMMNGKPKFRFKLRYVDPYTQKGELEYKRARAPYAKQIRTNTLDATALSIIALATVHCVDWEGVTSGGKPVPYSPEVAREFFSIDANKWMALQCLNVATNREEYEPEPDFDVEDVVKN